MIGAGGAIGGYTLANHWLAPDLGGAKSRDFALSIGPAVLTEFDEWTVRGSVNGGRRAEASFDIDWSELAAHAAENTRLRPGDLLVVGRPSAAGPVAPGDVVALAADAVGTLTNRVGS